MNVSRNFYCCITGYYEEYSQPNAGKVTSWHQIQTTNSIQAKLPLSIKFRQPTQYRQGYL